MTETTNAALEMQQPEHKTSRNTSTPKASIASDPSIATATKLPDEKGATKPKAQSRSGKKPTSVADRTAKRQTKASQVEALLARKAGATLDQMCEATGWQAHTCRAFMSGLRKKGRAISRETNKQGKSVYLMAKSGKAEARG